MNVMSYDIKKLSEVEALPEVPEGANMIAEVGGQIKRVPAVAGGGSGGGDLFVTLTPVDDNFSLTQRLYTADKTIDDIFNAIDEGKSVQLQAPYAIDVGTAEVAKGYGIYVFAGASNGKPAFSRTEASPGFKNGYYIDVIFCNGGNYFVSPVDLSADAIKAT